MINYSTLSYTVLFMNLNKRCSSMVGQTGRRQAITLGRGCLHVGVVAHEIGNIYITSLIWFFYHIWLWVNFKSKMLSFSEASSNCCYQYFYGINFTTKTTPMPTYNLYEIRYRSLRVTVEQIFAVYRSRSRFLPRTVQAWQRWICNHLPTKYCTRYSCHTLYNTFFIVWTWW